MTSPEATRPELLAAVTEAVHTALPVAIADLAKLVRIPSVSWSAFDPAHVAASAEAVATLARATGVFDTVFVSRSAIGATSTLGQPAVLATRSARNGKPTVLLYAHHDVQPPGRDADWDSSPFEPTIRGDRLYGRGAADDKAGVMTHIASIRALVTAVGPDFDLGLALFIEGEEEFGSRSFGNVLAEHRPELEADVIVVADSDNRDIDTPALTVSLRGNVAFRLKISTLAHASHSGMFGGAVPDAMLAAVRLLATLHDATGSVAVAGLTSIDQVTPEYPELQLRTETGLLEGVSAIGTGPILNRIWSQPAITVTGIDAPSVDNASNTLVPSVTVKISVRTAPGQESTEALAAVQKHLRDNVPFGAKLELFDIETGNGFSADTSGWAVAEAETAMAEAWGRQPLETGAGGSIPFIAHLVAVFPAAQILVTGVEDPDSRAHSPNESLHLGVFHRAILTEAVLLARLNERK